jgi:hypothetical protein
MLGSYRAAAALWHDSGTDRALQRLVIAKLWSVKGNRATVCFGCEGEGKW